MRRFEITATPLGGLHVVQRRRVGDDRGYLIRVFCSVELAEAGWRKPVAQINYTVTHRKGAVRGLHFQAPPHAEMKLVTCVRGSVWDLAVDLRAGSPTFLQWHAQQLSPENGYALLVPEGFAHGFQALTPDCELLYLHSEPYAPHAEGGINPRDRRLAIPWPLPVSDLSVRDANLPSCDEACAGIQL